MTYPRKIDGKPTALYRRWMEMRKRCRRGPTYLAKGIEVCERWDDFQKFADDMGEPPEGTWLERIDNYGNYEPSNCRWATPQEQSRNRTTNRLLTANGVTKLMTEWADDLGCAPASIWMRLRRGWSEQRACTQPIGVEDGRFIASGLAPPRQLRVHWGDVGRGSHCGLRGDRFTEVLDEVTCKRCKKKLEARVEMVERAAIRVDGVVWDLPRPARHHVLHRAWGLSHWDPERQEPGRIPEHEQGFTTSTGRFVGREEALAIAIAAKQPWKRYPLEQLSMLTSEDLW